MNFRLTKLLLPILYCFLGLQQFFFATFDREKETQTTTLISLSLFLLPKLELKKQKSGQK